MPGLSQGGPKGKRGVCEGKSPDSRKKAGSERGWAGTGTLQKGPPRGGAWGAGKACGQGAAELGEAGLVADGTEAEVNRFFGQVGHPSRVKS